MEFDCISVIPEVFDSYIHASILGRALERDIFSFNAYNLRDWTHDRHRTVDDAPLGGKQGMLMKPEPIFEAVRSVSAQGEVPPHVIFFSPCGKRFDQAAAEKLSHERRVLFVCGRYEGMDERCYELADEVYSIGDYIMTGAELASLVMIDSVVRLLPGALGDSHSARDESFETGLLEYEQYTRPANFEGREVPEILRSGNHEAIAAWQHRNALERTLKWRPDLLENVELSQEDQAYLAELKEEHGKAHGERQ